MSRSSKHSSAKVPALLAVGHAAILVIFLSWRFGGMDPVGRMIAGCLTAVAPLITVYAWRQADHSARRSFLRIVLPLAGIALLVFASALNPHMLTLSADGEAIGLIPKEDYHRFLPSTALPEHTLRDFLLNAGLVLTGLNLFLSRPPRSLQRSLLGIIAVNAAALACVGSAYKLLHAELMLGFISSPNPNFFATFFYYNHWGAFALLGAAAAGALALQYRDSAKSEGGWEHTPAPALGVLVLLLLISLPLSGSRASTAAGVVLALILTFRLVARSGNRKPKIRRFVLAGVALFAVLAAGTAWLAGEKWQFLLKKSSGQFTEIRAGGIGDARIPVYQATWKLYQERPVWGWGWRSFRYVFRRVQTLDFKMQNEQKEMTYVIDAHNDWLQFLAEMGTVGAILGGAALVGIARVASLRRWMFSPSFELIGGIACVGLMACVDFPFASPAIVVTAWCLLATAAAIAFDREREREKGSAA